MSMLNTPDNGAMELDVMAHHDQVAPPASHSHTIALHVMDCSQPACTPCSSSIPAVQVNPLLVGCYDTAGTALGIFTAA